MFGKGARQTEIDRMMVKAIEEAKPEGGKMRITFPEALGKMEIVKPLEELLGDADKVDASYRLPRGKTFLAYNNVPHSGVVGWQTWHNLRSKAESDAHNLKDAGKRAEAQERAEEIHAAPVAFIDVSVDDWKTIAKAHGASVGKKR